MNILKALLGYWVFPLFKRVDLEEAHELAEMYDHSYEMIVITAFVQHYLGGLEKLLLTIWAAVTIVGTWSVFTLNIGDTVLCVGVGFVLHLEYLYCRKGSSFLTAIEGLRRSLCPDKNLDGKYGSIQETASDIDEKVIK